MFGESEYDPAAAYASTPFEEQLAALCKARDAGKVREFGLSNETAWGLTRFCCAGGTLPLEQRLMRAASLLQAWHDSPRCMSQPRRRGWPGQWPCRMPTGAAPASSVPLYGMHGSLTAACVCMQPAVPHL